MNASGGLDGLQTRHFGQAARYLSSTGSTNQQVLEWAAAGAPHGAVVRAGAQTDGQGRQGRNWMSEDGAGLYASLLIRPKQALAGLASFSLVTAIVVAQVLEESVGLTIQLKWPNDLWWNGLKLGGILLQARSGDHPHLIVGIGVNLRPPSAGWPESLRFRAVSIAESDRPAPAPDLLLAGILNRLEPSWDRFLERGFSVFQSEWSERDFLAGREVMVEEGAKTFSVRVRGVDPSGELLVVHDDGRQEGLRAGEIHLLQEPGA